MRQKFEGIRKYGASERYPFECPYCDCTHATERLLLDHVVNSHPVEGQESDKEKREKQECSTI